MADSRPSTADEKLELPTAAPAHKLKGFFSRKKQSTTLDDQTNEKGDTTTEVKPTVPEVTPIPFTQLFRLVKLLWCFLDSIFNTYPSTRFSTKFELFINALGLVAAAASGAAQVCSDFIGPRDIFNVFYLAPNVSTFWRPSATIRQLFHYSIRGRCRRCKRC